MIVFGVLMGLIILVLLVVVHELGHAIVARRNGVVVEEFGIGFPPRVWGKKLKNGVLFTLNWLPIGGFVKLQGEHDSAHKKGDYGAATFWQKTKILFAGVAVNWIVAILLLTVLAWTGLPRVIPDQFMIASDTTIQTSSVQITSLAEGYPAEQAGFEAGDEIVSVDGVAIHSAQELVAVTTTHRGQTVDVVYQRDGEERSAPVALRDADSAVFGANLGHQELMRTTWSAPVVGVATTVQLTGVTLQGIGNLFGNFFGGLFMQFSGDSTVREQGSAQIDTAAAGVAGPIGILGTIFPEAGQAGLTQVIFLTAIISLTLAVMNTLPIPALDGGRWFVTALFRIFKKPLKKETEENIASAGFIFLMLLIVIVTVGDVGRLF